MPDYTVERLVALERLREADEALSAAQDERRAAQANWDWLNVPDEVVAWLEALETGDTVYRSKETKRPYTVLSIHSDQRSMLLGRDNDVCTPVSAPELQQVYTATKFLTD